MQIRHGDSFRTETMNILNSVQSWNRERRTRNALNSLSAHQLEDIGITRNAIGDIARKARSL